MLKFSSLDLRLGKGRLFYDNLVVIAGGGLSSIEKIIQIMIPNVRRFYYS